MSGKVLLDTNIAIAIFGQDAAVQGQLAAAKEVYVPVIVLGEHFTTAPTSQGASKRTF